MEASGSIFGPGDPQQERAIATRRAMEAARLARIKDPKSRLMGIDPEALAAQVAEKAAAAEADKALQLEYDNQRLQQDAQLAYLEQERLRAEHRDRRGREGLERPVVEMRLHVRHLAEE